MHRIPKNPSQIYSKQFVSGAEEAPSSSGSKRRAEGSSSLVSSPLANKRKRGDATQGGGKRRSLGTLIPQKGTVQTVQSEIAPEHGWGVGIGTMDNLEEVINSLLYPEPPPQVFSPPIDLGSHPEVSNAPNEEDICLDLSEYLINDEDDQPESLDAEMTMGSQGTELSDILLENLSITDLLNPSSDFGDPANALQDLSLDFLDEWTAYDENAVSGNQNAEINLAGEPEANHVGPFSGVWEVSPGQRRRINHDALQHFIKTTSPDLTMTARKLQETFKNAYKQEACLVLSTFDKNLKNLKDKWAEANPGQPKPWKGRTTVDREVIQNFITTQSPDLTMTRWALRDAYIQKYGEKSCPVLDAFNRDLTKLRDKWVEANPGQPKPWKERTKFDREALQNFITLKSPALTMSASKLRDAFIKEHGEKSCPSMSIFEHNICALKQKPVERNARLSHLSKPPRKNVMVKHEDLQKFIQATPSGLILSSSKLRGVFIKEHGEASCPSQGVFKKVLRALKDKPVEES